MRTPTIIDALAAARVLRGVAEPLRHWVLLRMLAETVRAEKWRRATGRAHPRLGDGTLQVTALRRLPMGEPSLQDRDFCLCLAQVFFVLSSWKD